MDRRKALKSLGLLSGGLILLPSCDFSKENVTKIMSNLKVTKSQESLLKNLVQTIIPETEVPGAGGLNIDEFVWVMVDDCLSEDQQKLFMNGLAMFETTYEDFSGENFFDSEQDKKVSILNQMMSDKEVKEAHEDVRHFIEISKSYAMLGFMESEYIMTQVMPYSLVPGKPPECRTIDPNGKINIYA